MKPVMRKIKSMRQQLGQGMTEYIVIVALIAVAAIGVYQLFGATIRNQTAGIAMEVSGKNGTAAKDTAKNSLSTYGDQANHSSLPHRSGGA
ncbi:pilus assembly protein [Janthinobacterium sp. SUN073]|uniref:Flp family type IVb pilin n=1 Tax=Janthinobacterium sp. SUN073 TaxID=3004102 RepID=UPI0025B123F3|nr:pilus assembly protein [Janthinobacterium sp. SUN073]MDN2696700.1 pilus assembly protein [Janthinobacterium sp. SUN073]